MKRAQEKGLLVDLAHALRQWAVEIVWTGLMVINMAVGAGMVLIYANVGECHRSLSKERKYDEIIYLTPDGQTLQQSMANQLSMKENLLLICGHYKGIDQRIRDDYITREISIGDYVLN